MNSRLGKDVLVLPSYREDIEHTEKYYRMINKGILPLD